MTDDSISSLLAGGSIKIKKRKSPKRENKSLSKEYKSFLNKKKKNKNFNDEVKNPDVKNKKLSKEVKVLKITKENKDIIKVVNEKDNKKSKNRFTKKSKGEKKSRRREREKEKKRKINKKFTKTKRLCMQYSNKKIDIQKFINDSKNKSNSEIKDILKKKGIDIKSNKSKLLKDIYLFTSVGNINIIKE